MLTNHRFARICLLLTVWTVLSASKAPAADAPNTWAEKDLLAVLRSDAPAADKAITCKRLAVYGSEASVGELAKLLADEQLASWARIALEAIPGPAVDEALRNASYTLKGKLLVGTLNSIGVRRDASAVDVLTTRLQDKDPEVAAAAAVALGHIGNAAAAKSLQQALAGASDRTRSAVAEGCVRCAERLHAAGKSSDAVAIYDEVRKTDVSKQRILEATRGAILARGEQGIPLLLEQFRSPEKALFQIALSTARELPGSEVDKALATEMARATPERAALMLQAMADRKDVVLPAVLAAAQQGPKQVRLSALNALGRVGNDACLDPLLKIAIEGDQDLEQAAKAALGELPSQTVDAQIVAILTNAEGKKLPVLIDVVGRRRIEATPTLIKSLDHSDPAVRSAALVALGETISFPQLSVLIAQSVKPPHAEDAVAAQKALKAASIRMPDREACSAQLVTALDGVSSVPTRIALMEVLGAVGGSKALATLATAAKGPEPELQDVCSRLLGEWTTLDAAPVLFDLAQIAPEDKYKKRALRGYIRIARQFVMPLPERIEMCRKAFEASQQVAEKRLVLEVLKRNPSKETIQLAIKAREIPELKEEASEVALHIAQRLSLKGIDVNEQLSEAGLETIK